MHNLASFVAAALGDALLVELHLFAGLIVLVNLRRIFVFVRSSGGMNRG
jgi:hypothetical protein